EDADLLRALREHLEAHGVVVSTVVEGKEESGAKFRDYFDYREPIKNVPSHRALALFRGRQEEVLRLALKLPEELPSQTEPEDPKPKTAAGPNACELKIAARYDIADRGRP